ncbi:hypothetical protein K3722_16470 [Leisingera caerulea]|uniref:Uncharacterized protein n=1 Tax=Leisingera caerulea TaxID=506591 RepID=A0ABY5WVE6_LEICA|nr:hypothetical protein [Leisingera caerulea]UWQ58060.1 hypothetical protein K3722_16470 [Leisingera caerulea]
MDMSSIQPRTESSLKRLARHIRREKGIKLTDALNAAAQQAGYQNYQHFKNQAGAKVYDVEVEISASWRALRPETEFGRVTGRVRLSRPVNELVTPYGFAASRRLNWFKVIDGRTLVADCRIEQRATALNFVGQAARTLQFIDATGLKPARPRAKEDIVYDRGARHERMPRGDHAIYWKEPDTGRIFCMNEPYADASQLIPEQVDWAVRNGYEIRRLEWGSLYWLNGGTVCDLISHKETGADIEKVITAMKAAPRAFDEEKDDVEETSGRHTPRIPA